MVPKINQTERFLSSLLKPRLMSKNGTGINLFFHFSNVTNGVLLSSTKVSVLACPRFYDGQSVNHKQIIA
jgi:hypothetical protein